MDLREKIVESVNKGVPKNETARRFGVHRATLKRYCKQLDERGTLQPEGCRQETEAGREGKKTPRRRSPREAVGYPLLEGRVPLCRPGADDERSYDLLGGRTALLEPKKDSEGPHNGTSS